jgi:hypothetical protein
MCVERFTTKYTFSPETFSTLRKKKEERRKKKEERRKKKEER